MPTQIQYIVGGAIALGGFLYWRRTMDPFTAILDYNGQEVLVHAPPGLRIGSNKVTIYFHGNGAKIRTVADRLLPVFDACKPSLLVMPQLLEGGYPWNISGGCRQLLDVVLAPQSKSADDASVCLLSHSGGYLASAAAIRAKDLSIHGVGLFDSLYGQADTFYEAVASGARLANYYGPTTTKPSIALASMLERSGLSARCDYRATTEFHEDVPYKYLAQATACLWG